jgi:glycerophosphoryl diester phosphodiesterase
MKFLFHTRMNAPALARRTVIAAHRGGALLWPENSLRAFDGAIALGVDQIETDVRLSADGVAFLHHDAALDRTTNATGVASELAWPQLAAIRLKGDGGGTIPPLAALLARLVPSRTDLRLEIKARADGTLQPGLIAEVAERLAAAGMAARTTVTSFDAGYLVQAPKIGALAGRIWLVRRATLEEIGFEDVMARACDLDIPEVAVPIACAGMSDPALAESRSIRLGFFHVNEPGQIARALALRASAFTSDRPDLALAMRDEHGKG